MKGDPFMSFEGERIDKLQKILERSKGSIDLSLIQKILNFDSIEELKIWLYQVDFRGFQIDENVDKLIKNDQFEEIQVEIPHEAPQDQPIAIPKKKGQLIDFREVQIISREAEVLKQIETLISNEFSGDTYDDDLDTIDVDPWSVEFLVEEEQVVCLSICGEDLPQKLNSFPELICELTQLRRLHFICHDITTLSPRIGDLTNLENLNLASNQLIKLPDTLGRLTALKELRLEENNLSVLPDSIGGLQALEIAWFKYNKLYVLPDSIGNLQNLRVLYLNDNKLEELPRTIGNLTGLKELGLDYNQDLRLSSSITSILDLSYLNYDESQITSPEVKSWIQSLERRGCSINF